MTCVAPMASLMRRSSEAEMTSALDNCWMDGSEIRRTAKPVVGYGSSMIIYHYLLSGFYTKTHIPGGWWSFSPEFLKHQISSPNGIIFHPPRFPWNRPGPISLPKKPLPFGGSKSVVWGRWREVIWWPWGNATIPAASAISAAGPPGTIASCLH